MGRLHSDLSTFKKNGWTDSEINKYFPILKNLSEGKLFELHKACDITMFSPNDTIDKEQAIHVIVNPKDTPKELLIEALLVGFFSDSGWVVS